MRKILLGLMFVIFLPATAVAVTMHWSSDLSESLYRSYHGPVSGDVTFGPAPIGVGVEDVPITAFTIDLTNQFSEDLSVQHVPGYNLIYNMTDSTVKSFDVVARYVDGTFLGLMGGTILNTTLDCIWTQEVNYPDVTFTIPYANVNKVLVSWCNHTHWGYVTRFAPKVKAVPIQAVLNTGNNNAAGDYRLVAMKDLAVRNFVELPPDSAPSTALVEVCIDEDVSKICQGGLYSATGTVYEEGHVFNEFAYLAGADSIDVLITGLEAEKLKEGTHTFDIYVWPDMTTDPALDKKKYVRFTAEFINADSFRIRSVPIQLKDSSNNFVLPDNTLLQNATILLSAAYPVDEDAVTNYVPKPKTFLGDLSTPLGHTELLKELQRVLTQRKALKPFGIQSFAVGVVPSIIDGRASIRELKADGVTYENLLGYTQKSIKGVIVTVDRSPSSGIPNIGGTIAHEIGHQLGFGEEYCFKRDPITGVPIPYSCVGKPINPPPASAADGDAWGNYIKREELAFDVSGAVGSSPLPVFDSTLAGHLRGYMGSGNDNNKWTTQIEYEYLYKTMQLAAPGASVELAIREVINIAGTIGRDSTATLDPFLLMNTDAPFDPPTGTGYSIEFRDSSNALLSVVDFGLDFQMEVFTETEVRIDDIDSSPFAVTVNLPIGTDSVTVLEGTVPLIEAVRSPNAPVVEIISIGGNETMLDSIWTGSDVDSDPLVYTIFYSPDGLTVELIAMEIPENTLSFSLLTASDIAYIPGDAFLRVKASDGFNVTETTKSIDLALSVPTVPYIQANGSDVPIEIFSTTPLSVTVELLAGDLLGQDADWWVLADTAFGWYRYNVGTNTWMPGASVTYQGPLMDLPTREILNRAGLPDGTYTLSFETDMTMNGIKDTPIFSDSVEVTIKPLCSGWSWNRGCWYTSPQLGLSCNEVCAPHGGFDVIGSQHYGNSVGKHFWPDKIDGGIWESVECSSTISNSNLGADSLTPDGDFKHPDCQNNCACLE